MENILFEYLSKYVRLTEEEKKAILDLDIFKQYPKGTIILKEGETSDYGFFIIKGCIRCYYLVDGEEKTTAFYTEAETLEPSAKVTGKPSEYSVVCVEDSIIIMANSEMEEMIFQKFPKFETLCRLLSEELLVKNKSEFDAFKISSPEQRYLNLFETRPDLLQRVPQYQLASFLGITAQSLSRMRNRLAENRSS